MDKICSPKYEILQFEPGDLSSGVATSAGKIHARSAKFMLVRKPQEINHV